MYNSDDRKVRVHFNMLDNPDSGVAYVDPDDRADIIESGSSAPEVKKRRGRPRKEDKPETKLAKAADEEMKNAPYTIVTNDGPVIATYQDTNAMLKHTIMQTDQLAGQVKTQLDMVMSNRTTNKPKAVADLAETIGSLLNTKVTAIRELNKTITDTHNLEIKRMKELKLSQDDKSNEQRIMELYNAYINMPVGTYEPQQQFAPIIDASTGQVQNIPMIPQGYNPQMNITPEMNRVLMGDDPNIKTVCVFDPNTQDKHFDVIDTRTGMSVPNYPRPSNMVLDGLNVRESEGIAVNKDLGMEFDLIVAPSGPMSNEVLDKF